MFFPQKSTKTAKFMYILQFQKNFLGIAYSFANHHVLLISLANMFLIIFFNIFSLNYCICILL